MLRLSKFNVLMAFVCAILSVCFVSCSNDDEPTYWECWVEDTNGEDIWDRNVSAETTEIRATVNSNYDWRIGATQKVRVTPSSGKAGSTPIIISFEANKSTSKRELYFTLRTQTTNYDREDKITIFQKGVPYILPEPSKLVLDKVGGKTSVIVKSNLDDMFEVETPSWITATFDRRWSEDGENYDYYYTLKYLSNPDDVRTSHVWFKSTSNDMSNSVYVIQNGAKGTPYE